MNFLWMVVISEGEAFWLQDIWWNDSIYEWLDTSTCSDNQVSSWTLINNSPPKRDYYNDY